MKMLDWPGFVKAFAQYDLIAKNVSFYGWLYPGIEFGLGVLYLTNTFITGAAWITVFIMSVGAIGVGKNLLSKDKVSCACLGTKINVPLTKVTFLEDIIMKYKFSDINVTSLRAIPLLKEIDENTRKKYQK